MRIDLLLKKWWLSWWDRHEPKIEKKGNMCKGKSTTLARGTKRSTRKASKAYAISSISCDQGLLGKRSALPYETQCKKDHPCPFFSCLPIQLFSRVVSSWRIWFLNCFPCEIACFLFRMQKTACHMMPFLSYILSFVDSYDKGDYPAITKMSESLYRWFFIQNIICFLELSLLWMQLAKQDSKGSANASHLPT